MHADPTSPQNELAIPPVYVISSAQTIPTNGKVKTESTLPVPFCT